MAVVSRIARVELNNGTGTLTYTATAATQDTAAGAGVVVTLTGAQAGTLPPAAAQTINVRFRNDDGTIIYDWSVTGFTLGVAQSMTFYFTNSGLVGGSPRCGTVEIEIQVTRTSVPTYDVSSDGNPNSGGITGTLDRGWIRGTTTATLTPSRVDAAYPDTVTLTADLAAASYVNRTLTLAVGPSTGASNSTTDGHTRNVPINTTFPAASTLYTPTATPPNATLTGQPFTVLTVTATDLTVDPRLTVDLHFQVDDNVYALADHRADQSMLASESGFLWAKFTNARGEAVSGVQGTQTLDPVKPGTTVGPTSFGTTGADGVGPTMLNWTASKPGGAWDWTAAVSSPSGYTGSYLVGSTDTVTMLSPNPRYLLLVGGGPAAAGEGDHFHAGDVLQVGLALVDMTDVNIADVDVSPAPAIIVGRFSSDGHVQVLQDDGVTWADVVAGTPANTFTLVQASTLIPGADSRVWLTQVPAAQTATWTDPTADFFVIGKAYLDGTPYTGFLDTANVGIANGHAGFSLDPIALAMGGILSQR